jgi:tagatose 6-phosphate kinase
VLVCSGSLPAGTDPAFYADCVAIAHAHGVPAVVDASGDVLRLAAEAGAEVLKPNLDELATLGLASDPVVAARLLQRVSGGAVIVSQAENGLVAALADATLSARLPWAVSGNATGAGDAVVAAIAHGVVEGMSWPERLRHALAWGAGAVAAPTAGRVSPVVADRARAVAIVESIAAAY